MRCTGCRVEAGAEVSHAILCDGAVVKKGARVGRGCGTCVRSSSIFRFQFFIVCSYWCLCTCSLEWWNSMLFFFTADFSLFYHALSSVNSVYRDNPSIHCIIYAGIHKTIFLSITWLLTCWPNHCMALCSSNSVTCCWVTHMNEFPDFLWNCCMSCCQCYDNFSCTDTQN